MPRKGLLTTGVPLEGDVYAPENEIFWFMMSKGVPLNSGSIRDQILSCDWWFAVLLKWLLGKDRAEASSLLRLSAELH